jgi:hypothetical protein
MPKPTLAVEMMFVEMVKIKREQKGYLQRQTEDWKQEGPLKESVPSMHFGDWPSGQATEQPEQYLVLPTRQELGTGSPLSMMTRE